MLHAVIMAGGSGTRFWPESREAKPKQLLTLAGDSTLLQSTVDRLAGLVTADCTMVVTGCAIAKAVETQLPQIDSSRILAEPCRRDTAPCIGWAALEIAARDPDAVMVVLPSDHVISPEADFRGAVDFAASLVKADPSRIVTFGIRPNYPASIYGYIERGERLPQDGTHPPAYQAVRFREKPRLEQAREYLATGAFYWNSGIFVWHVQTILAALEQHQPAMLAHLRNIVSARGSQTFTATLDQEFTAIQGISVDYAVLEHSTNIVVIEAPFSWDDVGSWQALARLRGTDDDGNTIVGRHLGIHTTGTIVRGNDQHTIVTLGLRDCLVVHTDDTTFVANKHDEEAVREVVRELRARGWTEIL